MTSLVEFIEARLKEDHANASAAKVRANGNVMYLDGRDSPVGGAYPGGGGGGGASTWDYNRALREVAAKRRLLDDFAESDCLSCSSPSGGNVLADVVLGTLAAVWSNHPDYNPAWFE